jgi:hypothetical protein
MRREPGNCRAVFGGIFLALGVTTVPVIVGYAVGGIMDVVAMCFTGKSREACAWVTDEILLLGLIIGDGREASVTYTSNTTFRVSNYSNSHAGQGCSHQEYAARCLRYKANDRW